MHVAQSFDLMPNPEFDRLIAFDEYIDVPAALSVVHSRKSGMTTDTAEFGMTNPLVSRA